MAVLVSVQHNDGGGLFTWCYVIHVCVQVNEVGQGQKLSGLCDVVVRAFEEAGLMLPVSCWRCSKYWHDCVVLQGPCEAVCLLETQSSTWHGSAARVHMAACNVVLARSVHMALLQKTCTYCHTQHISWLMATHKTHQ
jgi:hypothetical protein